MQLNIFNLIIKGIILYRSEEYKLNGILKRRHGVTEIDFVRRSEGISMLQKIANDSIRKLLGWMENCQLWKR